MKIFRMNDCDWVAAESLEDAFDVPEAQLGFSRDEWKDLCDDPKELTEEELDSHQFTPDPYDKSNAKISFREELNRRIQLGEKFPQFFASTEY